MRRVLAGVFLTLSGICGLPAQHPAQAADLVWEVESPFRLFKPAKSFALHEAAYKAVTGGSDKPPADAVWRTERRLNDPDCKDASTPASCSATKRARFEQSRLGWAAQTVAALCYETGGNPRRYPVQCERQFSWGNAKEDYILPEAHTVNMPSRPSTPLTATAPGAGSRAKRAARLETRKLACKSKLTIARVPYALDRRCPASPSLRSCRTDATSPIPRSCRGSVRCRARRQLRLGRKQSGPPGLLQRQPRDVLRPGAGPGRRQQEEAAGELRGRQLRRGQRSESPAAPPARGRGEGPELSAQFAGIQRSRSSSAARAGSAPIATARNTAIRSASGCSSRWRTATAPLPSCRLPARAPR